MKKKLFGLMVLVLLMLLVAVGTANADAPQTIEKRCTACEKTTTWTFIRWEIETATNHAGYYKCNEQCGNEGRWSDIAEAHTIIPATCTTDAYCTKCDTTGFAYLIGGTALGHKWGEWLFGTGPHHMRYCTNSGCTAIDSGNHVGGKATCTEPAKCGVCTGPYGNSLGHNWGDWVSNGNGLHSRACANDSSHFQTRSCSGGTATCTEKAVCDVCGIPYGDTLCHVPGAEATCTTDQVCTREGCGAVLNEKLGHDYAASVTGPTCTEQGYTAHTCSRCGDSYTSDIIGAYGHWYDLWSPNLDGTHSAECKRGGCSHVRTTECTPFEVTMKDGETEIILTVCPVCGDHEETPFDAIPEAAIEAVDKHALPRGEQIVRGMDAPFDGVLYAFTAAYEYAGKVEPFSGTVSVTLPLDAEQYAGFKLVRVDVTPPTETTQRTEVWTDVAFTFENGNLTFETDAAGLFLLIPAE